MVFKKKKEMLQYVTDAPEGPLCTTHLLIMLYLSVMFRCPDCDFDLGRRNLTLVRDTPSHYVLSFCAVSLNLLQ